MRKVDPANVRAAFKSEMNELLQAYVRIASALRDTAYAQSDMSRLASGTFLVSYVSFERFVSDLIVAYLNRDISRFRTDLKQRVLQSVESRFKLAVRNRTRVRIPKHPPVAELVLLADGDGRNLTFPDIVSLKKRAGEWLSAAHADRIRSLNTPDALLLDAARTIRDYVGHQSAAARKRMNDQLRQLTRDAPKYRHLGRSVNEVQSVGSFLKAIPRSKTRLEEYVEAIRDIAQTM